MPIGKMFEAKAVTVSQPYAELIASGQKFVENRRWHTKHRGPLFIHAGKGTQYLKPADLKDYTTGAIVATCELIACVEIAKPTDTDRTELGQYGMTLEQVIDHEHCEGPFAWVLFEVRRCAEPYRIGGKQGLWKFETTDHESFAY